MAMICKCAPCIGGKGTNPDIVEHHTHQDKVNIPRSMPKFKVYVTRKIHQEALDFLLDKCDLTIWDHDETVPKDELLNGVTGVNAILCTINDKIDKSVLDAAGPGLKIVATMSVGTHHVDCFECRKREIFVASTPDVASDAAAELTATLLLVTARRCLEGVDAVKNGEWGKWKPMWLCGTEFSQRTLGILGFGRVGFGVARRMKPFGVDVIYNDLRPLNMADDLGAEFVGFEELLERSDFLVISCALTGATKDLFNRENLAKMKPTAILINTSRGQIVDTEALTEALQNKKLAAAGVDLVNPSKLPADHPLMKMPNCIILPHLGTNSDKAQYDMAMNTAKNIYAVLFEPNSANLRNFDNPALFKKFGISAESGGGLPIMI